MFSSKRFVLILSWIGFAAIIIYINSYLNPNYSHQTTPILISLICFMNAGLLTSGLMGLNKKVSDKEAEQWKYQFKQQNKEELAQVRQVQFDLQTNSNVVNEEELEIKQFNEQMSKAEETWKVKNKADYTPFEEFHSIQHKLRKLKKVSTVFSLLLSLATGLMFLNFSFITLTVSISYTVLITVFMLILYYATTLSKQSRILRKQIYPKSVADLIKDIHLM